MKKYKSITFISFELDHDEYNGKDITEEQIHTALMSCVVNQIANNTLVENTVNELADTKENNS